MNLHIENCNNIDSSDLIFTENLLNIKYAINGTGKSTIAKAITYFIKNVNDLQKLLPYKYQEKKEKSPLITGLENIESVMLFDEEYVNNFIFLPDELIKSSFDIFINTKEFEEGMAEINTRINIVRRSFIENDEIEGFLNDMSEISASFGSPVKNGIHKSSSLSKALSTGNRVENIPKGLEDYQDFIQYENNYRWIKWQIDGSDYLEISDNCPYCTSTISEKREKIKRISEVYDPKSVEHLNKIVNIFNRLNQYFSSITNSMIKSFITNSGGYTHDQVEYLLEVKLQIDRLALKMKNSKNLGFKDLKEVEAIVDSLNELRIDINLYPHLNSKNTKTVVDIINNSLDELLKDARILEGKVNIQKKKIEKIIREYRNNINEFLWNAGYEYEVDLIEDENSQYKLKLKPKNIESEVVDVKGHLSFGERNAFALVLFMFDAIKNNTNLIILDDPISSFDKNKKFAIIEMLFAQGKSFDGKSVLMLTHDLEPIIDMIHHHRNRFRIPEATFLENIHGTLIEKPILRKDIQTFIEIIDHNVNKSENIINKLVYLRRYFEIIGNKGNAYQLISNVFHKRSIPIIIEGEIPRKMTEDEISNALFYIHKKIPSFCYDDVINMINNEELMKELYENSPNNYEKLHIYRIIFDGKNSDIDSPIFQKFINESFHIENDYIYQLNPCQFQIVPQYIIDICDNYINNLT